MNAAKDVCRLYFFASIILSCGCAFTSDARYEATQTLRVVNAWREFDQGLLFSKYSADYARGWKAGFRSVLVGGDGRPPVLPPRRYWDPSLFRDCSNAGQQEWLKGFSAGAVAAKSHNKQHFVRPFFSSCHSDSCSPTFEAARLTPPPIQHVQTTPAVEFDQPAPACTIRLLGIEPIDAAEDVDDNSWPIAMPADSTLPSEDMTKELSPKPAFEDNSGDKQ